MKRNLLVALSAIVLFTACSNDEDEKIKNKENVQIGIKFDPSIVATKTRAIDDKGPSENPTQDRVKIDEESTIYIYFFDGSDKVVGGQILGNFAELTGETGMVCSGENITTNIKKVILVANVPDNLLGKEAIKTYEDLKKAYVTVKELNDMYNTEDLNFWLVAEGSINNWQPGEEGKLVASVALTPHPIFSRIDVTVNLTGSTGLVQKDGEDALVNLKSVDILYGGTYGNFTSETPTLEELIGQTTEYLTSGIIPDETSYWSSWYTHPKHQDANQLGENISVNNIMHGIFGDEKNVEKDRPLDKAFTKSFYLFPSPSGKDVILTIYGERSNESTKTPVFWSVHFNGDAGSKDRRIEQGNIYTVTLSLKGDYTNPSPGEETPEVATSANITVTVEKEKWKEIIELGEVTFN